MANFDSYEQGVPCWVDLGTTDVDAAQRFYSDLFGWASDKQDIGDGNFYAMQQLKGRSAAAIYDQPTEERGRGIPPHWGTYFAVNDADAAATKVSQAGGTTLVEPFDVFDFGRMFTAQDPQGGVANFWQAEKHIGAGIASEPGALAGNELICDDLDAAAPFYEQVMGSGTQHDEKMGYTFLTVRGEMKGGILKKGDDMKEVPTHWHVYFQVGDADAAAEKVKSLGGKEHRAAFDTPAGRSAVVEDPQGAVFSVIKPAM